MFSGSLNFFAYVFLKSVAAFNISEAFDPDLNPSINETRSFAADSYETVKLNTVILKPLI